MNAQAKQYRIALFILTLCCLLFAVRGFISARTTLHLRDFKPIYAASRCLLANCNPYDTAATKQEYIKAGGVLDDGFAFHRYNSTYPPSTFFLFLPVTVLHWSAARILWLALIALAMAVAAFLMIDLSKPYAVLPTAVLMGLSILTATILMMLGQPAGISIGLCVIATWCLLKQKHEVLAVVLFAISLVSKPQIGAFVWLYFFLANSAYRKRALQIAALTIVLILPGIVWVFLMPASKHWLADFHANIAFNVSRGGPADPGPADPDASVFANLQSVISLFRDDPHFYNPVVDAIMGVLLLVWGWLVIRTKSSFSKDFLALAAVSCFTLLPVYHRNYDSYLFFLTFPALALLLRARPLAGWIGAAFTMLCIVVASSTYGHFIVVHLLSKPIGTAETLIVGRTLPVALLVLGVFYLIQFSQLKHVALDDI